MNTLTIAVLNVKQCTLVNRYKHFREDCCLHLLGRRHSCTEKGYTVRRNLGQELELGSERWAKCLRRVKDLKNIIQSRAEDNKLDDSGISVIALLKFWSLLPNSKKFFLTCFKVSGLPFPCIWMPLPHAAALKMGHQVPTKHGTYSPKYVAFIPNESNFHILSQ